MGEWLADYTDSGVVLWAVDHLLQPIGRIAIVLLLASIALRLLRRAIRNAVERVQDPQGFPGQSLRQRVRIFDDAQASSFSLRRAQRVQALGALAISVVGAVVWAVAFAMVLGTFGVNLGPLIAGAGIVGIALGFGAQNLVKDFLSGVLMLLEDQYGVGDVVNVGEATGVIEAVTLRTTRVRDVNGTLWYVPNGEIRRVGNMSQDWARVVLDIGVSYGTDVDLASRVILEVAEQLVAEPDHVGNVLEEPAVWGVQNLGDSSVDIRLVIKTVPGVQWAMGRELRRRIKQAFDELGIEIPFPQRTMWLRTEAAVAVGDVSTPAYSVPSPTDQQLADAVERTRVLPAEESTESER